jgi:hypothetical protein
VPRVGRGAGIVHSFDRVAPRPCGPDRRRVRRMWFLSIGKRAQSACTIQEQKGDAAAPRTPRNCGYASSDSFVLMFKAPPRTSLHGHRRKEHHDSHICITGAPSDASPGAMRSPGKAGLRPNHRYPRPEHCEMLRPPQSGPMPRAHGFRVPGSGLSRYSPGREARSHRGFSLSHSRRPTHARCENFHVEAGSGGEFQRPTDAAPLSPSNSLVAVCGTGVVSGHPVTEPTLSPNANVTIFVLRRGATAADDRESL